MTGKPEVRRRAQWSRWRFGASLAALSLAACGGGDRAPSATPTSSDGSSRPPPPITLLTAPATTSAGGFKARLAGTAGLTDGGCVVVDGHLLVAPEGARVRGDVVEIPGYPGFRVGDHVVLGGGEAEAGAPGLPGTTQCGAPSDEDAPHWVVAAGGPAQASPPS